MTANKETPKTFARDATGLIRQLGAFDSFVLNFLSMNLLGVFILGVFGIGLYPSADMPLSIAFAAIPALVIALTYVFLSVAMPRTGGDYVWVSRILNPAVGFMVNFGLTFILFTFIALDVVLSTEWGIGAYFYNIAVTTGSSSAASIATFLSPPPSTFSLGGWFVFGIAAVFIVLVSLAVALGLKSAFRVQKIVWVIVLIATLVYLGVAFATPHSTFLSNFRANSGTNDTAILNGANQTGYSAVSTITISGTLLGFVYIFLNFTGFNYSAYASGEVRNNQRSQTFGMIASLLVFAGLLILIIVATQYVFGYNLFNSMAYLFDQIFYGVNPGAPYPASLPPPMPMFLVGYLTSNPLIIFIVCIGFALSLLVNAVSYIFVSTRNMFAWSFDRSVPDVLSRVDERFHSPYVALIVTAVLGVVITFFTVFTSVSTFFSYITFLFAVLYTIVGIAAVAFPYRKKSVFESSPPLVKKKVGGVPVIAILGVLSVIFALFIGYSLFTPSYSGSFIATNFEVVIAVLVVPLVIYGISYAYRKSKGIDITLIQREIPPE
jgi:basic amino acid/polyamine antiporter, APA family